jgi:hypothetical protein
MDFFASLAMTRLPLPKLSRPAQRDPKLDRLQRAGVAALVAAIRLV